MNIERIVIIILSISLILVIYENISLNKKRIELIKISNQSIVFDVDILKEQLKPLNSGRLFVNKDGSVHFRGNIKNNNE